MLVGLRTPTLMNGLVTFGPVNDILYKKKKKWQSFSFGLYGIIVWAQMRIFEFAAEM